MERWGRAVKHYWPLEDDMVFLNHGSYGACPKPVMAAQRRWQDRLEAQPCRFIGLEAPGEIRCAAAGLAAFVGADADDVVFVENTTSGINAIFKSFGFKAGDRVVALDHVYNANRNALKVVLEPLGGRLDEAPLGMPVHDEDQVVAAVERALANGAAMLLIDHVASVSAVRMPVKRIVEVANGLGVPVLVDGAHAPGMVELDVPSLGADWYVGNCHKWLCAPKGAAFVWASKERQVGLHPTVISHDLGLGFTKEFDKIGTRDASAWLSVPEALRFHEMMGGAELRARNHALAVEGGRLLASRLGTEMGVLGDMFGAMATVRLPEGLPVTREEAMRIKLGLWHEHRIEAHVMPFDGALWLRISIQAYNELEDVEALAEVLPKVLSS